MDWFLDRFLDRIFRKIGSVFGHVFGHVLGSHFRQLLDMSAKKKIGYISFWLLERRESFDPLKILKWDRMTATEVL